MVSKSGNFNAGSISRHFSEWVKITSDKDILSDVEGMTIECTELPVQHYLPVPQFSEIESTVIDNEINELLTKEVIKRVPKHVEGTTSNIFLRPKKDGS